MKPTTPPEYLATKFHLPLYLGLKLQENLPLETVILGVATPFHFLPTKRVMVIVTLPGPAGETVPESL